MSRRKPDSRRLHIGLGVSGELAPSNISNALPPDREALVHFLLAIERACPECVRELATIIGKPRPTIAEVDAWRQTWRLEAPYWEGLKAAGKFEEALHLVFSCWRGTFPDNEGSPFLNDRWIGRHAKARRIKSVLREVGPKALASGRWSPVLRLAIGTKREVRSWRALEAGPPAAYFVFDPSDINRNGIWSPPDPIRETQERGTKRLRRYFPHGKKTEADALWNRAIEERKAFGAEEPEYSGTPLLDDFLLLARFHVGRESFERIATFGRSPEEELFPQRIRDAIDRAANSLGLRRRRRTSR